MDYFFWGLREEDLGASLRDQAGRATPGAPVCAGSPPFGDHPSREVAEIIAWMREGAATLSSRGATLSALAAGEIANGIERGDHRA